MNTRYDLNMEVPPREAVRLLYISKSRFGGDWRSVPHTHACTEMFYCVSGRGQFNIERKLFDVAPDDLIIVNPRVQHTELSYQTYPLEYIVLGIDGAEFLFNEKDLGYTMLSCGMMREELLFLMRMLLREMGVADGRVDPDGALAWKSYRGVAEDLQEYLGTDPEKLAGELAELFYEEVGLKRTAYPTFTDVKAMMEALRFRGLWIGVATTDDLKSTRRCLEGLGVEEYISFWGVSGEGLPEKPDGRLASLAAGHWGIWKDEIAMVGDNPNDMRFARNGGAVAIGVKSGTGTEDMLREQADYLLDSVDDLVDLIDQINTEEKRNGTYSVKACV